MSRYTVLSGIVRDLKPEHVVEIGTWKGKRAAAFMGVSNCYYTGFDLFEEATPETDEQEFNVKAPVEMIEVGTALNAMGFNKWCLVRGNTHNTLHSHDTPPFDFCFIDGGHSVDTISHDFEWALENITPGGTIILDDYYDPLYEGFGCNHIVDTHDCEVLYPHDGDKRQIHLVRVQA